MRGAPQVGFSATIRKIKARSSLLTRFRPPFCLTLETHVQYRRNPARCQFTTALGVNQDERLLPAGPTGSQRNPEQFVQSRESTARSLRVQSQQLLTEGQIFKDEVLPGPESADHPPEEMPERQDHGKKLIGQKLNRALRQVIHLWVYSDLARHRYRRLTASLPSTCR